MVFEKAAFFFFEATDGFLGLFCRLFGRSCPKMGSKMVAKNEPESDHKVVKKVIKKWLKSEPKNEHKWCNSFEKNRSDRGLFGLPRGYEAL